MEQYATPLFDALEQLRDEGCAPFYMPGHKGRLDYPFTDAAGYDLTEIPGADSLYDAQGAIFELEQRLASAYGAGATLLSAGGSTLCIQTMLSLVRKRSRQLLAARNLHRAAVAAMGLLGLEPVWIPCPSSVDDPYGIDGLAVQPDPAWIEELLCRNPDAGAVYLTSPDYFGQMADIPAISDICHRHGVWLVVDNAHGAHLNRFRAALHPMQLGADLCCDSLHKNLPVLTGGAVLHLADPVLYHDAKYAMSLFGSSSPSYLIMLSVDRALPQMEGLDDRLLRLGGYVGALKDRLAEKGYQTIRSFVCDPIRLAVGFGRLGYTAASFYDYLHSRGIEPEYVSDSVAVFLPSPNNTPEELALLERVLLQIIAKPPIAPVLTEGRVPRQVLSIAEAMSRPQSYIWVDQAEGRIAARVVSNCPPGTPVAVPGEEITAETINLLKSSGVEAVYVVK
ncbi:MAG: aminotransferase class I/II-fold pyridoxal phosphate-dependent enzyme [Angelakisella sp.]